MTEFEFPKIDLDEELFIRGNPLQAMYVILNRLAYNDLAQRAKILGRLMPESFTMEVYRFLFENMVDMIQEHGGVDIEGIRQRIYSYAPGNPDYAPGFMPNYDFLLTFDPTPEQVDRALVILTTPPPVPPARGKVPRSRLKR